MRLRCPYPCAVPKRTTQCCDHGGGACEPQETDAAKARGLDAIGQLATSVAHEINTPIQCVADKLRFLKDGVHALADVLESLQAQARAGRMLTPTYVLELLGSKDLDDLLAECPKAIQEAIEGVDRICKIVCALRELS